MNLLGLKGAITNLTPAVSAFSVKNSKASIAFVVAGLITATNWIIQTELTQTENDRANELIKRVNEKKTVNNDELSDYTKANQLEGSLVKVKGELGDGRFIVKRSRAGQEGYIVLAPFVVGRVQHLNDLNQKSLNEKYMLNLGWIPKESKHTIRQTAAVDILEFDQLPEELASEEDAPATSTITAYVRKGEEQDLLRGYRNFYEDKLFKFIDLKLLQSMYLLTNKSGRFIYLDRVAEEGSAGFFPFPNTQENYIDQLKQEISYNNKRKEELIKGVGVASFATAALAAFL